MEQDVVFSREILAINYEDGHAVSGQLKNGVLYNGNWQFQSACLWGVVFNRINSILKVQANKLLTKKIIEIFQFIDFQS